MKALAPAGRWRFGPATLPLLLLIGLTVTGCCKTPGKRDSSGEAGHLSASCMKDLPGDPAKAAQADVSHGMVQLYSYVRNGVGVGPGTPGIENCPSRKPPKGG